MDLSAAAWLAILGTGGIGFIVKAIIDAFRDRNALKHAKPREDMRALNESLEAQGKSVDRLSNENRRLSDRLSNQDTRIEALERLVDRLERQIGRQEHEFEMLIRFTNHLIAAWPSLTIAVPAIPAALREHLATPPAPEPS